MLEETFSWNRDYKSTEILLPAHDSDFTGISSWRTERLENPTEVFVDIHGLLPKLKSPGNQQLRGRRGMGKTMYLLNAQYQLGSSFSKNKQIAAAYIDLKQINEFNEIPSLVLRTDKIFRNLINILLSGINRTNNRLNRFCLESYLDNIKFSQRFPTREEFKKLSDYLSEDNRYTITSAEYEEICDLESQISHAHKNQITHDYISQLRDIERRIFPGICNQVQNHLIEILNKLKAKSLVVFIDEFSSPTVFQGIQVLLLDRLIKTFDHPQLSFKIATIPGTTILYENYVDKKFKTNNNNIINTLDFESRTTKKIDVIHTGNFEIFLRNLIIADQDFRKYINDKSPTEGFNQFIEDIFDNQIDFYEFMKAGEGLPRQMLETFHNANNIRKSLYPDKKLNSEHIKLASRQSIQITYQAQIRGSKSCLTLLAQIYALNNRIMKIERHPNYTEALDILTHWGFIHACPIPATYEPDISEYPLEYYYTSYRTEIANQISRSKDLSSVKIEDLTHLPKDNFRSLYPKAKAVTFNNQKAESNK